MMNKLWKNWMVHNLVAHPLSEVAYWVVGLFRGKAKAEEISGLIHDITIPKHAEGTGRG